MSKLTYSNDDIDLVVERILSDSELHSCGLGKRKVMRCLKSFQGDEIATAVFLKKYALRDDNNNIVEFTLEEAKDRWAQAISEIENSFGSSIDTSYFRELYDFFLPAGRQMYALGNPYVPNATFSNCYVVDLEDDSIEGIFDAAKKMAKTFSYGGGVGLSIGKLRPKNAKVSNSAKFSTGAVSFMELFSTTASLIGQNGRRAALLLSIPVNHPDVEDFIEIKHNNTDKISSANISIMMTDDFMRAVETGDSYKLVFKTGHETIEKTIDARVLWKKIIVSAHDSAEPGILFYDVAKRMSPSDTYPEMEIKTTNPCGELWLEKNGACCLGSLLLHKFVENPFTEDAYFNFELFEAQIKKAVRHLDNIVEANISRHALQGQRDTAAAGRRIGLGITGLADMLVALGLKYDSEESLQFVEKVMFSKMQAEYTASAELAWERGCFKLFDANKHFERGFCKQLPENIKELCKKGLRNVTLSTVAPSGSLSIIGQCSSGIEPVFALSYKRYVNLGSERSEFVVTHPGLQRFFEVTGAEDVSDVWRVAHQINYHFRILMQSVIQSKTDSSISSTINLPRDIDINVVSDLYMHAWKSGLKGITVYREGSREGILVTETDEYSNDRIAMDTTIKCVRAEGGDKFYIMISYKNGNIKDPYQVFVLNYKRVENDSFVKISNAIIKMLLSQGVEEKRVEKYIERSQNSLVKLTRFLSLSMKTGNLDKAVEILEEHAFAGSLASRLYNILSNSLEMKKALCKRCKGSNVRMEEGCMRCLDCDWSGCN